MLYLKIRKYGNTHRNIDDIRFSQNSSWELLAFSLISNFTVWSSRFEHIDGDRRSRSASACEVILVKSDDKGLRMNLLQ